MNACVGEKLQMSNLRYCLIPLNTFLEKDSQVAGKEDMCSGIVFKVMLCFAMHAEFLSMVGYPLCKGCLQLVIYLTDPKSSHNSACV